LPVWAGVLPVHVEVGAPIPEPDSPPGLAEPVYTRP
jgi:hypothetical protein